MGAVIQKPGIYEIFKLSRNLPLRRSKFQVGQKQVTFFFCGAFSVRLK